jgi:hypothetical protein
MAGKEKLSAEGKEQMKELATKYGLTGGHFFEHPHYIIITRAGIDRVQARAKIEITYEHYPDQCSKDHKYFLVKGIGTVVDDNGVVRSVESFGEVSPDNNKNAYPIAMAEKRAMSRVVLKLAGFYELGVMGEDESESFKRPDKTIASKPTRAAYKGN